MHPKPHIPFTTPCKTNMLHQKITKRYKKFEKENQLPNHLHVWECQFSKGYKPSQSIVQAIYRDL